MGRLLDDVEDLLRQRGIGKREGCANMISSCFLGRNFLRKIASGEEKKLPLGLELDIVWIICTRTYQMREAKGSLLGRSPFN